MRSALVRLSLAALVSLLAADAGATVRPLVKVRFASTPRAAAAGATYQGAFEIVAIAGGEVTGLRLEGEGWSGFTLQPPDPIHLTPDQVHLVQFQAVPSDPNQPLDVVFSYDGRPVRKRFDLSPLAIQRLGQRLPIVQVADTGSTTGGTLQSPPDAIVPDVSRIKPAPLRPRRVGEKPLIDGSDPEHTQGGHLVTISGRFTYFDFSSNLVGAHGVTVKIYDEEDGFDDHLGSVNTLPDGTWLAIVEASESAPDIYMEFHAANNAVDLEEDTVLEDNYVWTSVVYENFTGSTLNHGTTMPANTALHPVLHILSNVTRTWLWLDAMGYATPHVDCKFPVSGTGASFYDGEINVRQARAWTSRTHIHEFGHHWVKHFGELSVPDYDNGICDTNGPGHCLWCEENISDAWNEGFPDWLADVVGRHITSAYGAMLQDVLNVETTQCMDGDGNPCDCAPLETEGYVAALLRDIEDGTNDNDPGALSGGADALTIGPEEILWVHAQFNPTILPSFTAHFSLTYPQLCEGLWLTQRNNGFAGVDNALPGVVGNLASPSHAVNADSSADGTIVYTWTRAPDDCSGTQGYAISLSSAPSMPTQTMSLGNVTSWVTGDLGPGKYFFNIRARDRSGKWSNSYASLGPIFIREPHPADLALQERPGWDHPVVPRNDASATLGSVPAPTSLAGDAVTTRYNWNVVNAGELLNTTPYFKTEIRLDGAVVQTDLITQWLYPGDEYAELNGGPVLVRGGRHTFEAFVESEEAWPEHIEVNNRWAKQWAWRPPGMSWLSPPQVRFAPPSRTGGWSWIKDDNPFDPNDGPWDNCDGLRMPDVRALEGDHWRAVAVHAQDLADNYDADLHFVTPFNYVENGFSQPLRTCQRPAGHLDAVLVNDFAQSTYVWDVGVVNTSGGTSQYVADYERSAALPVPDSIAVTMGANEMIRLFHFFLPPATAGPTKVTLTSDSLAGLHVQWFDAPTHSSTIADPDAEAVTGVSGTATLVFYAGGGGPAPHGLVIFRDPLSGTGHISFGLKIRSSLHDYVSANPNGWDAPIVPRPDDSATAGSAPRPVLLVGDQPATWLNLAFQSNGAAAGSDVLARVYVDDATVAQYAVPEPAPGTFATLNHGVPITVPGGRHMLALRIDPDDALGESDESDNGYAEQYVWRPSAMTFDTPVTRPLPGDPYAGWGPDVRDDEPLWINVDGLRSAPFGVLRPTAPWWGGIAMMPKAGADADLQLFEISTGTKDGFDSTLVWSGWGPGLVEFALVNFQATLPRTFDLGVESPGMPDGTIGDYTAQCVYSSFLGDDPVGVHGPYEMFPDRLLHLYALRLSPARVRISLEHMSGAVDWGVSLYSSHKTYSAKRDYFPLSASWAGGPGVGEGFEANIVEPGLYCVAVWKRGAADQALEGGYRLIVSRDATSAPGGAGAGTTALAAVWPNPVGPSTTIEFELSRAGEAALEIYDVAGSRVRTLASGTRSAGRHSVRWDGTDERGHRVARGVYLIRLSATGETRSRKIVLLDR